ncbi:hypothetical protein RN001_001495 [Aquatica leii]|uniref:THAP4-like heme-binding domain-containing protein n=1 Tax=Aquatica leii TaxID=1421715 RepID=A0AAN7SL98_9COLE|nr:hypothetical protein RN001_001495 [Aquatica leii]
MQPGKMHETLEPLRWLMGRWKSVSAKGKYPTIKPFTYCEEMEFLSIGQPMLNYKSITWHPEDKRPMHLESGHLRINPACIGDVSLLVSHNFGLVSLEEGTVSNNNMNLKSTAIARMKFAKDPAVTELVWGLEVCDGDILGIIRSGVIKAVMANARANSLPVESDGAREEQVGERAGVQGAAGLTQVGLNVSIQDIITMVVATITRDTDTTDCRAKGGYIMMYELIEFCEEDGGGISVIKKDWLTPRKTEVRWPSVKETKAFNTLLESSGALEVDKWKLYKVKRRFYETDDLRLARAKEKLLETNSDLASEEDREVVVTRHKRKPARYISESESDEGEVSQLPRPPPIKRLQTNSTNLEDTVETHSSFKILPNTFNASLSIEPEIEIDQRAFQYKTLQFLSTLKEQNEQIINQNNNILKLLEQNNQINVGRIRDEPRELDMPVSLPINNDETLKILEDYLKILNNANNLIHYLSSVGGKDVACRTNNILKSKKKPFCDLKLRNVIVDAVKKNSGCTNIEVENCIKVWLKHAPERLKAKQINK